MNRIFAALFAAFRRWQRRRPAPSRRSVSPRFRAVEPLEDRLALAADLAFVPVQDQTVLGGAPLWLGIDGFSSDSGDLTYTVSVSNPDLLTASLAPASNSSLQMDVASYGQMTFQLFDDLAPRTTAHIKQLVERGDFSSDALLPVKWYRIAHFMDDEDFVIQGGPQYVGSSPLGPFDDEYNLDLQFTSGGLLGMGKSNDDTNDASIFVTGAPTRFLDFNHSIFGVLTEGDAVRQAIQRSRAGGDGPPPSDIVITGSRIIHDAQNAALMLKAAKGASGETDVTLTVTDAGHVYSQTFHVTVSPDEFNSAPFLADLPGTITTPSDTTIALQLQAIDAEGDASFFDAARPGSETVPYTLEVNHETGLVAITPPAGFQGRFRVQLGVRGVGMTTTADQFDTQVVEIVVGDPDSDPEPENHPPIAGDDAAFAYAGPGKFYIDVLGNDTTSPDEGETLTLVSVNPPESGGSTAIEGSQIVYTPGPGFIGRDMFSYTISDGHGGTATGAVIVTVSTGPTNAPHVGMILQLTAPDGTPLTSLAPGQEFVLHVLTQDQSAPPQGVYAAYLDIQWDAALAAVTGAIQYSNTYVNGMLGDTALPGLIDDAGSFAGFSNLGGFVYEVFSVPMRAMAAGQLEFTSNPADNSPVTNVLVYGRNDAVPVGSINYGSVAIAVGELSPLDINRDGYVTPIDALIIINTINDRFASGIRDGSLPSEDDGARLDTSEDGFLTPVDALVIINRLNGLTTPENEEAIPAPPSEAECTPAITDQYLLVLAANDICLESTLRGGRVRKA